MASVLTRKSLAVLNRSQPVLLTVRHSSTVEVTSERKAMLDRMIRVDHAGEYGADRIYAGQVSIRSSLKLRNILNITQIPLIT